jgi:hypothetical protein
VTPKKFNGAQVRFRGFAKTRTIYFSIPPKEERQNGSFLFFLSFGRLHKMAPKKM